MNLRTAALLIAAAILLSQASYLAYASIETPVGLEPSYGQHTSDMAQTCLREHGGQHFGECVSAVANGHMDIHHHTT